MENSVFMVAFRRGVVFQTPYQHLIFDNHTIYGVHRMVYVRDGVYFLTVDDGMGDTKGMYVTSAVVMEIQSYEPPTE